MTSSESDRNWRQSVPRETPIPIYRPCFYECTDTRTDFLHLEYDWIKCLHTAVRFSAQTDPTHLQISRDHRYCRQHVSCETSISVWPENINTSVQAIAAIPALLIKLKLPNPIFVAICFTWNVSLIRQSHIRKMCGPFRESHTTVKIPVVTSYFT